MVKAVFFDVANTLLFKPDLFVRFETVLRKHAIVIDRPSLQVMHKIVSEVMVFPDKTSRDFYYGFNRTFLHQFGIAPGEELLNDLFESSTYLPWSAFDDVDALRQIDRPLGVLSNWDSSLPVKLNEHVPYHFQWVLGSADVGVRKPQLEFFEIMMNKTGLSPNDILFVGDSVRLDIEPALTLGIQALLIDRLDFYKNSNLQRITSLHHIHQYL